MKTTLHSQVIVVGAGIAGLTAALTLQQSGIDVLVLEAEQTVGGRMRSITLDDALIDTGAQFLSTAYTIIPKLIQECDLSNQYVRTSEQVGIIINNSVRIINMTQPWQLISKRILSLLDFLRLGMRQPRIALNNLNDLTAYTQYDHQTAEFWANNYFGKSTTSRLLASIVNGFYFQSLGRTSAALPAAVLALSRTKPHTMTLTNGMGSLTDKLAAKLNIKTNVTVTNMEENINNKIIFRWPYAMPYTPIGRAEAVKKYRDSRTASNMILLAGDYLGLPWTDSAAQTGIWVANTLLQNG